MIDFGGEVVNSAFVLDVDPTDVFNVDAAGPKDQGKGKGKIKAGGGRGFIDPAMEVFMSKNPSTAEVIAFITNDTPCVERHMGENGPVSHHRLVSKMIY